MTASGASRAFAHSFRAPTAPLIICYAALMHRPRSRRGPGRMSSFLGYRRFRPQKSCVTPWPPPRHQNASRIREAGVSGAIACPTMPAALVQPPEFSFSHSRSSWAFAAGFFDSHYLAMVLGHHYETACGSPYLDAGSAQPASLADVDAKTVHEASSVPVKTCTTNHSEATAWTATVPPGEPRQHGFLSTKRYRPAARVRSRPSAAFLAHPAWDSLARPQRPMPILQRRSGTLATLSPGRPVSAVGGLLSRRATARPPLDRGG
ncbi:MAG: hypothetical protein JWO25_1080 [Alphaproteobacteria bacterium]|nr:hypothetical protein [Alphaproteobacteria bacterium]